MQISRRLTAVSAMVTSGSKMADIGTDHAYIPIYLAQTGRIAHAVAMDVNRGPLARAQEHVAQYGLGGVVETRLSDGLEALVPGEADSVVIAGMGGPLTVRILEAGPEQLALCRELILQPQSEIWSVRAWLGGHGWRIVQEDMVCEDGKYYPMMRAVHENTQAGPPGLPERPEAGLCGLAGRPEAEPKAGGCELPERPGLSRAQLCFGPLLLRDRHPVLREFLLRERELNRRILTAVQGRTGAAAAARAAEVREELAMIEKALAGYEEDAGT